MESLFNAASHGHQTMVMENEHLCNVNQLTFIDKKWKYSGSVSLLCCWAQDHLLTSLSTLGDFHSHHLHPDSHQNCDMKSLPAVRGKIPNYKVNKELDKHTPTASPEIGKRPHFMEEIFMGKKINTSNSSIG